MVTSERKTSRAGHGEPTIKGIQDDLRLAAAARRWPHVGAIGERIFQRVLSERGFKVIERHQEGHDFAVNGRRVDVKARVRFESAGQKGPVRVPSSSRQKGVGYAYVIFRDDAVIVDMEDDEGRASLFRLELSWSEALRIWPVGKKGASRGGDREVRESVAIRSELIRELRVWIRHAWGQRSKIIFRTSKGSQESMGKAGWGPEAFWENPKKPNRADLVVLLYFDGEELYDVFAYPIAASSEIKWRPKPVGPNPGHRKTFDPKSLPSKFKFGSIARLKAEYATRFPVNREE